VRESELWRLWLGFLTTAAPINTFFCLDKKTILRHNPTMTIRQQSLLDVAGLLLVALLIGGPFFGYFLFVMTP
jgi:hypothetical protein